MQPKYFDMKESVRHSKNNIIIGLLWILVFTLIATGMYYTRHFQKDNVTPLSALSDSISTEDKIPYDTIVTNSEATEEVLDEKPSVKKEEVKTMPVAPVPTPPDTLRNDRNYKFEEVMWAIAWVESHHDDKAENGKHKGFLQISPVLVEDVNQWLEKKGSDTRYTLADRFDRTKSIEMFFTFQERYNPEKDIIKAARIWKHGAYYTGNTSQLYLRKMFRYLEEGY